MDKPYYIIYEDNHLLIVNKAPGILVQGDRTGDITLPDLAKEYIREKYNKPGEVFCGVVHRLDRPVSGLVVLARTSKGLERMSKLFQRRDIEKTYWAITKRKPQEEEGKLVHWLVKDEKTNTVKAYEEEVDHGQRAELRFRVMGNLAKHWLLEIKPLTGRPHQIRVQLSTIGCPIRGDIKYGFPKPNPDKSINLHARRLEFIHPVKQEPVICIAPLPGNEFWEQFMALDDYKVKDKLADYIYG